MKKVMLAVIAIIGLGLIVIFRPIENEDHYDISYNTSPASSFSYIRTQTGKELQDAIISATGNTDVPQVNDKDSSISADGIEGAIEFAQKAIGSPYQFGGAGEVFNSANCASLAKSSKGINAWDAMGTKAEQYKGLPMYDCSGLTLKAYESVGYNIGRNTTAQMLTGKPIDVKDRTQWKRGDLIFPHAGHVVIYLGNDKVIHAPEAGRLVKEANVWFGQPVAVRRIIGD